MADGPDPTDTTDATDTTASSAPTSTAAPASTPPPDKLSFSTPHYYSPSPFTFASCLRILARTMGVLFCGKKSMAERWGENGGDEWVSIVCEGPNGRL